MDIPSFSFEEFNGTEKIAYLPDELPIDGSLDSYDPDVGSLCYYIPWRNLCFFYQDFRASSSLIPLGRVESGAEFLERLDLVSSVTADIGHNEAMPPHPGCFYQGSGSLISENRGGAKTIGVLYRPFGASAGGGRSTAKIVRVRPLLPGEDRYQRIRDGIL